MKFFFLLFCRNRNLMVPRACNMRFLKIVFDSAKIFERSIHPWKDMGAPTSRCHSLSTRANPLLASPRISLADVSAPISPGQAYARAASGYATPSFQPTVTSTPIQAAASMPPPPPPRPATSSGSGSPQHHRQAAQRPAQLSTSAAAASWHAAQQSHEKPGAPPTTSHLTPRRHLRK